MRYRYVKYAIPYTKIYEIINRLNTKKVIFHIDLQSICRGLYNKENVFYELKYYVENNQPSNTLVDEYRFFLNDLYTKFRQYSPFFITFYDDGKNEQNTIINSGYKDGRSSIKDVLLDDKELYLHKEIKKLYFIKIQEKFTIPNHGQVFYLKEFEADLIPMFCLNENLYNSQNVDTLNIILSTDKDLLQCCKYRNTIQCTNRFIADPTGRKQLHMDLFDDLNSIIYIYKNFKPNNRISAKYIPLILALSGDTSDRVIGLKGIGPSKAINLIETYSLPTTLLELEILKFEKKLPRIILDNFDQVSRNYKIVCFNEQIKRIKTKLDTYTCGGNK